MLKSALKKKSNFTEFETFKPTPLIKKNVKISSGCDVKIMTPVITPLTFPRRVPVKNINSEMSMPQKKDVQVKDLPRKVLISTPQVEKCVKSINSQPIIPQRIPLTEERIRHIQRLDDYKYFNNTEELTNTACKMTKNSNFSTNKRIYAKSEQVVRRRYNNPKEMDKIKKRIDFSDDDFINEIPTAQLKKDKENITYNIPQSKSSNKPFKKILPNIIAKDNIIATTGLDLPPVCFTPSHNSTFISSLSNDLSPIKCAVKLHLDFETEKDLSIGTYGPSMDSILWGQSIIGSLRDDTTPIFSPLAEIPHRDKLVNGCFDDSTKSDFTDKSNKAAFVLSARDEGLSSLRTDNLQISKFNFLYDDEEIESMLQKLDEININ